MELIAEMFTALPEPSKSYVKRTQALPARKTSPDELVLKRFTKASVHIIVLSIAGAPTSCACLCALPAESSWELAQAARRQGMSRILVLRIRNLGWIGPFLRRLQGRRPSAGGGQRRCNKRGCQRQESKPAPFSGTGLPVRLPFRHADGLHRIR